MLFPELKIIVAQFPYLHDITELDRGGQKAVYKARSDDYGTVVLKITERSDRLTREVAAVTEGGFSHVPRIYAHGTAMGRNGDDLLYLIEEFVEGETLRAVLQKHSGLPLRETMRLLNILLQTAVEIESRHLVHRDIKPENIMSGPNGAYWLLDFGIARHLDLESITKTAEPFGHGTLGYAPPEQLRNLKRDLDIRADLFAIGLVAYECITGINPFVEGTQGAMEVLKRISSSQPPPPSIPEDDDGELSKFIMTLMARAASLRPQSASEALSWYSTLADSIEYDNR